MKVLLDTCVLSELRRPNPDAGVQGAVDALDSKDLFVSVLSVGEIAKGILLLQESHRKQTLQGWLRTLEHSFADRLLGIDVEISRIWAELTAVAQQQGQTVLAVDGLIAATARRYGLHVMTRNVADFRATGVMTVNPWNDKTR